MEKDSKIEKERDRQQQGKCRYMTDTLQVAYTDAVYVQPRIHRQDFKSGKVHIHNIIQCCRMASQIKKCSTILSLTYNC